MKPTRFIIEGTWSGYKSSQQKVVHRKVYLASYKKRRSWAENTFSIPFSDGTVLMINVRDCTPRERVEEILGYTKLIDDAFYASLTTLEGEIKRKRNG